MNFIAQMQPPDTGPVVAVKISDCCLHRVKKECGQQFRWKLLRMVVGRHTFTPPKDVSSAIDLKRESIRKGRTERSGEMRQEGGVRHGLSL